MAVFDKIDPAVRRETGYIALCTLILSAVMEAVFLIAGRWDLPVLLGNILGAAAAVLNFLLMGLTVQKAVDREEAEAKASMKLSQSVRMVMLFAVAAAGVGLSIFNGIAVIVPLFFPRVAVAVQPHTPWGDRQDGGDGD